MKCNLIKRHIYSCLRSLQLWSDEASLSNPFWKYHSQPPFVLCHAHLSSKTHNDEQGSDKKEIDVSVLMLSLAAGAVWGGYALQRALLQNGISIILEKKSGMYPDKEISSLAIWRGFSRKMLHY